MAMTDTKSKTTRRDADGPGTTGKAPSLSTTDDASADRPYRSGADPDGQAKPTNPEDTSGPAPAQSYAGSGTTDPVELNPATHGTHYRGSTGDV